MGIKDKINKLLSDILGAVFLIMMLATLLQIIARFTPISINWTEELARLGFVFITFFGLGIAFRDKEHIVVSSFIDRLSPRNQAKLKIFVDFLLVFFTISLMRGSFVMMRRTWGSPTGSLSQFGITIGHKYLVIPIGSVVFLIYIILDIKDTFKTIRKGKN